MNFSLHWKEVTNVEVNSPNDNCNEVYLQIVMKKKKERKKIPNITSTNIT